MGRVQAANAGCRYGVCIGLWDAVMMALLSLLVGLVVGLSLGLTGGGAVLGSTARAGAGQRIGLTPPRVTEATASASGWCESRSKSWPDSGPGGNRDEKLPWQFIGAKVTVVRQGRATDCAVRWNMGSEPRQVDLTPIVDGEPESRLVLRRAYSAIALRIRTRHRAIGINEIPSYRH